MPRKCSDSQYAQIETLLEQRVPCKKIGPLVIPPVSYTTVLKVRRNVNAFGQAATPRLVPQGRPPKITKKIAEVDEGDRLSLKGSIINVVMTQELRAVLFDRPSMYADELAWHVYDTFGVFVSESTILRWLRKSKMTKTKIQYKAAERCPELRDAWMARLIDWKSKQLLFVDESAANERTKDRKFGWSPRGKRPWIYRPCKRSERWSILPCYSVDGYLCWEILQGSFTAERFNAFMREKVLPLTTPFPGPRSVIIMDNASIHRTAELRQMCEDAGVVLAYLPPYSPDFNPIEQSFAELKTWLKRNARLAEEFGDDFGGFLELGVRTMSNRAGKHFYSCHINMSDLEEQ
jgi:transposase